MSSYVCRRLETSSPRRRRAGAIAVRGLHFAIVDEADSVLIDEARTPLILSANVDAEGGATRFRRALDVVGGLLAGRDYRVSETEHRIEMTTAGRQRATSLIAAMEITSDDWIWRVPRASEELIVQALSARYLYRRDKHYIVTDGKVQIVDEYTGLVMADRSWEHGPHQMIETKEGCELTGQRRTQARITYQCFFRRYLRLCGT